MAQILLVGDDVDVRALAQARLPESGHVVTTVAGVPAALRAAERLPRVDLVVLDLDSHAQAVLALLERLRSAEPSLPALLLTRQRGLGDRAARVGALWLHKPFRPEELAAVVESALAGPPAAPRAAAPPPPRGGDSGVSRAQVDADLLRDRTALALRRELAGLRVRRRHGYDVGAPSRGDRS